MIDRLAVDHLGRVRVLRRTTHRTWFAIDELLSKARSRGDNEASHDRFVVQLCLRFGILRPTQICRCLVKLVALVATNTGRVNVSLKSLDRRRRRGQHCRSTFELSDTGLQRLDCRNQRLVFGVGSNDSSFGLVSVGYCVTCIAERPSISFELGNGRLHCSGNCCSIKAGLGLPNCGKTVGHLNAELIALSACRIETKAGLGHLGSRISDRAGTLRCSNERFVGRNRYALPLEIIELAGGGSGLVESFGVTLGCGEIGCGLRRCTLQRFHVRVTPLSYRIESDDEFVKAIVGCLSEWSTIDIARGVV